MKIFYPLKKLPGSIAVFVSTLLILNGAHGAEPGSSAEEVKALRALVEQLSDRVRDLEGRLTSEASADSKEITPTVSLGSDGFTARSADTNFVMNLHGFGQFDSRFFFDDPPARDTFLMRRLRLLVEGIIYRHYDFRVQTDFGSGLVGNAANNALLLDAAVNVHYWDEFQIEFGKFKEPVSLEILRSATKLLFVERGLPVALAPNRDVGIQIHGKLLDARLNYAVGIFNGVADGTSGDIETRNEGKHFSGRIIGEPFKNLDDSLFQGIGLGIAGTYGDQVENLPTYVTTGRQRFFSYAATASPEGAHWRVAPQGYYYFGPFGLYGEYILSSMGVASTAGPVPQTFRSDNTGWNVAASYVLTGERNSLNRVTPLRPMSLDGSGWGAWEIAARFGELSVDDDSFAILAAPSSAQRVRAWEIGLNWYLNKNLKFNFDYSHSYFSGEIGGGATSDDEKVFLGRTQFSF